MSFPQTRHTLIQRIAAAGDERDWREFLTDYWGPVCRFASRFGRLPWQDAEDAASQTFVALLQNQLLVRWVNDRSAKLRTLLCGVVRNVLANRARVQAGRARLLREHGGPAERSDSPAFGGPEDSAEQVDAFYAAWADELLQRAVEGLLARYHEEGKGDYFRVLYGRLCDGMTLAAAAQALGITQRRAEIAYKDARTRLGESLEGLVREHVGHYCPEDEAETECALEWAQLGQYLKRCGGLEEAVRRAYEDCTPLQQWRHRASRMKDTLGRVTEFLRRARPSQG